VSDQGIEERQHGSHSLNVFFDALKGGTGGAAQHPPYWKRSGGDAGEGEAPPGTPAESER